MLGDIVLTRGSREVRRLRAGKYAFLLSYLCLHPERAVTREELIDLFWPEADLEQGRLSLRTALASLRRQLEEPALFLQGSRDLLRIDQARIVTDVREFELAVRHGKWEAKAIYGGELLPGCFMDWAVLERERLALLYEEALQIPETVPESEAGSTGRFPSSLPAPSSPFCGRLEEVNQAVSAVRACRLVSLVGLGGMGKTRIAIEVGKRWQEQRPVFFLPLAKIKDHTEVRGLAADCLDLDKPPFETLEARIVKKLSKDPALLVLDNFEHLLENNAVTDWVERLLERVDTLKILITSRVPLLLEGENVLAVEPMKVEDACEMFLDRARSVLPDFKRSELLSSICLQLEGMPLAIALCAARANVLTAKGMLDALDRRWDVLRVQRVGSDERQSSLRSVLEWTCPVKNPLHTALTGLTVFRGGWTFEAASAILSEEALATLSELRRLSLIRVEAGADENRFSMLDAVRDYAVDTGDLRVIEAAKRNHAEYYRAYAHRMANLHEADEWACFRGLEAESTNIFSAFEYGLRSSGPMQLETLRTLQHARWALWVRGFGSSLLRLYELAESLLAHAQEPELRANLDRLSGEIAGYRGEPPVAISRLDEAADLFLNLGLKNQASDALQAAADYCVRIEDWQGAIQRINRQIGIIGDDLRAKNIALAGLANVYLVQGDFDSAELLYIDLQRYWQRQPLSEGHLAMINRGLAACFAATGRVAGAIPLLAECIRTFARMGLRHWEVKSWAEMEAYAREVGDAELVAQAVRETSRPSGVVE